MNVKTETSENVEQDGTRRSFMRKVGGAAMLAGASPYVGKIAPRYSPVGRAEAVAPLGVAAWAGVSISLGLAMELAGKEQGLDPEEVEELTAEQAHQHAFESILASIDSGELLISDVENEVRVDDVDNGSFANNLWSEIRYKTFLGIEDEKSESQTIVNVQDASDDLISDVLKNIYESWNNGVEDREIQRYNIWRSSASNDELDESDVISSDGSTYEAEDSDVIGFGDPSDHLNDDGEWDGPSIEDVLAEVTIELPNGENLDVRAGYRRGTYRSGSDNYDEDWIVPGINIFENEDFNPPTEDINNDWDPDNVDIDDSGFVSVKDPSSDDTETLYPEVHDINDIIETILEYRDDLNDVEIPDYVENVTDVYDSGDIDSEDILTGREIVEKFGDSTLSRRVAESMQLGYAGDIEDVSTEVTVAFENDDYDPDEDGDDEEFEDEKRGILMLDFEHQEWLTYSEVEYNTDDDYISVVDDPTYQEAIDNDQNIEYYAVGDGVEITTEPTEDGNILTDYDDERESVLESPEDYQIGVIPESIEGMAIHSHVKEMAEVAVVDRDDVWSWDDPDEDEIFGEDVAVGTARLVVIEDDEPTFEMLDDGFTIKEVHDDDRDYLKYQTWVDREPDSDRSLEFAIRQSESEETIDESLSGSEGGGGGTSSSSSLMMALFTVVAGLFGITVAGIIFGDLMSDE